MGAVCWPRTVYSRCRISFRPFQIVFVQIARRSGASPLPSFAVPSGLLQKPPARVPAARQQRRRRCVTPAAAGLTDELAYLAEVGVALSIGGGWRLGQVGVQVEVKVMRWR